MECCVSVAIRALTGTDIAALHAVAGKFGMKSILFVNVHLASNGMERLVSLPVLLL